MTPTRPSFRSLPTASLLALLPALFAVPLPAQEFAPNWESLAGHRPPAWFGDAKFGIFIHWGVYAVPSFCDTSTYSEWYQHWLDTGSHGGLVRKFHERVYGADFEYRQFAEQFRAELWDPAQWAAIFKRAGAQYIVITSKHHDGFCLWPSDIASEVRGYPWNAAATGPRRDLLGELAQAVRAEGIRFGLYYSFMEWHNPLFDKSIPDYVERVMFPQVKDLIARYRPDILWPDGEWNHPDTTWRSTELLSWLYANVPNEDSFIVNDRWGKGLRGRRGDFFTTEYGDFGNGGDSYSGQRAFEECRGIGHSFAFNRLEDYDIYLSRTEAVRTLIDMVSRGGNLLLDIGPDADGTIPLIMVDRLFAIGDWLRTNGEAIHGTTRSPFRDTPWGRATQKGNTVYLHVYDWPQSGRLVLPLRNEATAARVLGEGVVPVRRTDAGIVVDLRAAHGHEHATVVAVELDGAPVEDTRFLPDGDGMTTLPVTVARLVGDELKLEKHVDRHASATLQNLGYWSKVGDSVVWDDVVVDTGTAPLLIELEMAVAPGSEGGTVGWQCAGREGEFVIPNDTGAWQRYERVVIGGFTAHPGASSLTLTAKAVKGQALLNLRTVRLVPDRSGKIVGAAVAEVATPDFAAILRGMEQALEAGRCADVAAVYADDADVLGSGGVAVAGREAIDAYWAKFGKAEKWRLDIRSTEGAGDLFVQAGRSRLERRVDGALRTSIVDFVLTWRRQGDGAWRIVSDVYWPVR
ncbi:MAG: alpha-L-fucosidase [Planctomycetes bacterium]|nr:alpha-L-fucosidase [Planctomycetota bacterium]